MQWIFFVSKPGTVADFGSNPEKSLKLRTKDSIQIKYIKCSFDILRVPMHYEGIQFHSPF